MKLSYRAAGKDGKIIQGVLEAKGVEEAAEYLRGKDITPIKIEPESSSLLSSLPFLKKGIKSSDLVLFTRQLSSMLSSGLTLMRSLEILKDQMQNPQMQDVVIQVISEVEEGKTLADAMQKHPKIFTPIYVSIIRAGEKSGLLDKVLNRLADNLEKQEKLKGTVKSALMYPIIVIVLMGVVMIIMMVFVIPQLTVLYENLNVALPLPTQLLVGFTNLFIATWPIFIAVFGFLIYGFRKWRKTKDGEAIVDATLLKLPVFGKLINETILAEFSRTFGLLVGTGTLVVEALVETADTTGNVLFKNAVVDVSREVEKGVTIGDAMSNYKLFPPLLIQLVKVGEQTGKIDETLVRASEYFEREVDQTVKTLTTAMEPFIMIVLGIGVAFLIISVITPIYSLISSIQ